MKNRNLKSCGAAFYSGAALCLALAAGEARAQDVTQLQDIIVTAQKRSESLQRAPLSVAAISAATVEARGIEGTGDLAVAVPGVSVDNLLFAANPSIRGISQTNVAPGDEPAAGVYIDGVYIATPNAGLLSFNSIERVEILKGPQGTLFGRNAAAGVINVITKTPSHEPSLDASVGYGNYSTVEARLYGTTGISSDLAADVALYYEDQNDGWGKNLVTGKENYKGYDFAARSKLSWDIGPNTNATLAGDYSRRKANVGISMHLVPGYLGLDGATRYAGFYDTTENLPSFARLEQWGTSLKIKHEMEWASLVNITAYRETRLYFQQDQDVTPLAVTDLRATIPTETFSEEFQILSPDGSAIKWIGGFFYLDSNSGWEPLNIAGTRVPPTLQLVANQATRSYSGFAQATAPIAQNLNLTLGARYTEDHQHIVGGNRLGGAPLGPQANQRAKFSKITYKAALDYSVTEDILSYVSYDRGFKSGLFNSVSPNGAAIRPTVVDAIEVGLKTEWFDNRLRLNAAAFYYWITDVQLTAVATGGGSTLYNAAKERSRGFDVSLEALPMTNLTLTAGVAYTDAIYTSFKGAPLFTPLPGGGSCPNCFFDATGTSALETPRWAGNLGLQYVINSKHGTFALGGNYAYVGKVFWSPGHLINRPAYNMLNATIKWTDPSDTWDIRLWGKNLLDEKIYAYMNEFGGGGKGSPGAPLTFGVTFGVHLN